MLASTFYDVDRAHGRQDSVVVIRSGRESYHTSDAHASLHYCNHG